MELQGTRIFVLGYISGVGSGVALLKPNGSFDPTYGTGGVAVTGTDMVFLEWSVTPDGSICLQGITPGVEDDFPSASAFNSKGVEDLSVVAPAPVAQGGVNLALLPNGSPLAFAFGVLGSSAQVSAPNFSFDVNAPFAAEWNALTP